MPITHIYRKKDRKMREGGIKRNRSNESDLQTYMKGRNGVQQRGNGKRRVKTERGHMGRRY